MFEREIKQLADNLSALRQFVDVVGPVLESRKTEHLEEHALDLGPMILAINALDPDRFPMEDKTKNFISEQAQCEVEVEENADGKQSARFHFTSTDHKAFDIAFSRFRTTHLHLELLYQNSLVSLVSIGEWFLSQILHKHFDEYPESAGIEGKSLTLSELKGFDSVDIATAYLIDSKVEEILRGSFEDWISFFKKQFKLEMHYIDDYSDRLIEICQRRNIIIHNAGHVNEIYRSKVAKELQPDSSLEGQIGVTKEYLEEAVACFESAFVLIAAELWKQRSPNDETRSMLLIHFTFEHLVSERWAIAEAFSKFLMEDESEPERDQLIGLVNYWQCLKWQGRFEEISSEVENTDFSAKDELFRLGQLALLDDESGFFKLLPLVLETGKLKKEELVDWPLFRSMRETETYRNEFAG